MTMHPILLLLWTWAIGAPLVALHTAWVIRSFRRSTDPKDQARVAKIDAMRASAPVPITDASTAALSGLIWPLLLVDYVLTMLTGRRQ